MLESTREDINEILKEEKEEKEEKEFMKLMYCTSSSHKLNTKEGKANERKKEETKKYVYYF